MIYDDDLIIRALEPSDVDLLYEWENNMQLWHISNTITPFSKYQLEQFVKASSFDIYQTKQLRLMVDFIENDVKYTVGMLDMFDFDPYHSRAGLGIMIHEKWRRKKIAYRVIKLFVNYASTVLGIHNIYCNVDETNHASFRLFRLLKFKLCASKREWLKTQNGYVDEFMFQFIMSPTKGKPDNI